MVSVGSADRQQCGMPVIGNECRCRVGRFAVDTCLVLHALADFYCAWHVVSCGLPAVSGELDLSSVSPRGNRTLCALHDRFLASRATCSGTAVVGLIEQVVVRSYIG